ALEVVNAFDLLAEPAAHLGAGIAGGETDRVVILQQIIEQIFATTEAQPRNHLAAVEAERQSGPESEGRILAPIIIKRCVADLDRPILHGVEPLQARHDLARGEGLDLEFVVRDLGNTLGKIFAAAIERIERLWPACRQPPFDLRAGLRDRRRGNRGRSKAQPRRLQEFTTFHGVSPVMSNRPRQGTPSRPRLPRERPTPEAYRTICGGGKKIRTEGSGGESRHTPRWRLQTTQVATCSRSAHRLSSRPFNWLRARHTTLSNRTSRRGERQASTTVSEPIC